MTTTLPTFERLNEVIERTKLKLHPAEAHGLVSGLLCGESDNIDWDILLSGDEEERKHIKVILESLFEATREQLKDFDFKFALLLPSDEQDLEMRAEALSSWCQGFLTGLKVVNIPVEDREPGDVTEAIDDLLEMSQLNYEDVVDSEEDEEAYVHLVEYVRMAVILVYQSQHDDPPPSKPNNASKHLH